MLLRTPQVRILLSKLYIVRFVGMNQGTYVVQKAPILLFVAFELNRFRL